MPYLYDNLFNTGEAGIEPALTVLETAFLPLEDSPIFILDANTHPQNRTYKSNSTGSSGCPLSPQLSSTGQAGHSLSAPRPTSCHLILRCASAAPSVCPCKHGLPSVPASCPPSSLLGQAFVRLVAVSSIHYCTSTPALSTSSSSRGLISFRGEVSSWRGLHA